MQGKVKNRVLFQSRRLSVYLVRYSVGHRIEPHVDMVSEGRLYKLNCVLVKPESGGEFSCERNIFNLFGRIILFRPGFQDRARAPLAAEFCPDPELTLPKSSPFNARR
ncbi:MAG TPA: hypothetical protein VKO85_10315 [Wenzhouxiangellaceae bacterium]|nr:hypothetical protein [Wenzhouxiangellaceae bacterium]